MRKQVARLLTRGAVDLVAGNPPERHLARVRGPAQETVERCATYLLAHPRSIDDARFLREGLPIASGVIEGACRYLVKDRMAITGARWGLASAEAVLRLRSLITSGDWAAYWAFHCRKEHDRTYPWATPWAPSANDNAAQEAKVA